MGHISLARLIVTRIVILLTNNLIDFVNRNRMTRYLIAIYQDWLVV